MKYIKERFREGTAWNRNKNQDDKELNIQSNLILDQLVKCRDYVIKRVKETYLTPFVNHGRNITCNIVIYTDKNPPLTIFISTKEDLEFNRKWGTFLQDVEGKCEIDFIMTYTLNIKTMDNNLEDKMELLKEDLGDMEITKIHNIGKLTTSEYRHIKFDLKRKKRVVTLGTGSWMKKINKE